MTVTLRRGARLTTIRVEKVGGVDGQGLPNYGTPVTIQAYWLEKETKVERLQVASPGDEVQFQTLVLVDGGQPYLPDYNDRLTKVDTGEKGIVIDRVVARPIRRDVIDHVRLGLREE